MGHNVFWNLMCGVYTDGLKVTAWDQKSWRSVGHCSELQLSEWYLCVIV